MNNTEEHYAKEILMDMMNVVKGQLELMKMITVNLICGVNTTNVVMTILMLITEDFLAQLILVENLVLNLYVKIQVNIIKEICVGDFLTLLMKLILLFVVD